MGLLALSLIVGACSVVVLAIYMAVVFVCRRTVQSFPSVTHSLRDAGELLMLALFAIFGAAMLGVALRWVGVQEITPLEAIQGVLLSVGFLLVGAAGLYGATLKADHPSFLMRAYSSSTLCRVSVRVAATAWLVFFTLPLVATFAPSR